ncbi:MAG: F0F1 ATP synthase subunit B [Cyclobacteriaceae bacterium]|jgi:F-type H+-transporting ATPase subunit b|nr:F0F1 ATP synthase subunit B [Cyclobacteriaceae bacterium]
MDLLTPGIGLIFWQTVVFLLLVVLLGKMAWKPILNSLKERDESIRQALETAEKARQEMATLKADNEILLKQAREERDKILRESREVANRMKEEAQLEARNQADKIIADARAAIDIEKQAALREVKIQVASFALEIAERLLKKNLTTDEEQKQLVRKYLEDLKLN